MQTELDSPPDDRKRARRIVWFVVGTLTGVFLMLTQATATAGWTGLLAVGEYSPLRPFIEARLGDVALAEGLGHDGQISYAIGSDLMGQTAPPLIDHPGYRYRRILFPALASGFGTLDGHPLFVSMLAWSAIGLGLAAAAGGEIGRLLGMPRWAAFAVLANPGVWLSLRLLSVDLLAFSLALLALSAYLRGRWRIAVFWLVLAVLAKDQYLLVAASLAGLAVADKKASRAAVIGFVPAAVLAGWSIAVSVMIGSGMSPGENFALPLTGIAEGVSSWGTARVEDIVFGTLALAALAVLVASMLATRSRALILLAIPWIALAVVSSASVWNFGNNAMRAFSPVWALAVTGIWSTARNWRASRHPTALAHSGAAGDSDEAETW